MDHEPLFYRTHLPIHEDDVPIVSVKSRAVLWLLLFDPIYIICASGVNVLQP